MRNIMGYLLCAHSDWACFLPVGSGCCMEGSGSTGEGSVWCSK